MFALNSVAGELEKCRRVSAFTNNLTALLGLLALGFPVSPATIRTTVAGWNPCGHRNAAMRFEARRTTGAAGVYKHDACRTSKRSQRLRALSHTYTGTQVTRRRI